MLRIAIWLVPTFVLLLCGAIAQSRAIGADRQMESTLVDGFWVLGFFGAAAVWFIVIGLIVFLIPSRPPDPDPNELDHPPDAD